jgi:hypothetical protein
MRLIGPAVVPALSLVLAPLAVETQQGAGLPRIVVLSLSSLPDHARALEEGLRALGYTPGMTIAIDHRSAEARAAYTAGPGGRGGAAPATNHRRDRTVGRDDGRTCLSTTRNCTIKEAWI